MGVQQQHLSKSRTGEGKWKEVPHEDNKHNKQEVHEERKLFGVRGWGESRTSCCGGDTSPQDSFKGNSPGD